MVIFVYQIGKTMARPEFEPEDFLTKNGRTIFFAIIRHIKEKEIIEAIDTLELSMLANSMEVYQRMAETCNKEGFTEVVTGKNGSFNQIRPEYTVMRNEYQNVLKHSGKFGLTPGDRHKIFGGLKKKKRANPNDGLDDDKPMRIAQ